MECWLVEICQNEFDGGSPTYKCREVVLLLVLCVWVWVSTSVEYTLCNRYLSREVLVAHLKKNESLDLIPATEHPEVQGMPDCSAETATTSSTRRGTRVLDELKTYLFTALQRTCNADSCGEYRREPRRP